MNQEILKLIENEINNQKIKWGGYSHDASHTNGDWANLIHKQAIKLFEANTSTETRDRATKIAALSISILELLVKFELIVCPSCGGEFDAAMWRASNSCPECER